MPKKNKSQVFIRFPRFKVQPFLDGYLRTKFEG